MKKLILSAFLLAIGAQGFAAQSITALEKITQGCKDNWPFAIIPAVVTAGYAYNNCTPLHEFFKNLHADKIQKGFKDLADLEQGCQKITLGVHTEKELLLNIEKMGLDKHNALQPVYKFKSVEDVVNGYTSWVRPWCWTEEMKRASVKMQLFLQQYGIYKTYFEYHHACLRAWVMDVYYKPLVSLGVTDFEQAKKKAVGLSKASGKYYLVDAVDHLLTELCFIKAFLKSAEYKSLYPTIYERMHELLSVFELTMDCITSTNEYRNQAEKSGKDGSRSSSVQDFQYS